MLSFRNTALYHLSAYNKMQEINNALGAVR